MSAFVVLLDAVERLSAMLEAENALLGKAPPRAVAQQLAKDEAEKRRLALIYERGFQTLKDGTLPQGAERERLKSAVERFTALMEEHRRKLGALRQITERLIKTIGEVAQGSLKPVQTYNARAVIRPAFRTKPVSLPLAVNRTI